MPSYSGTFSAVNGVSGVLVLKQGEVLSITLTNTGGHAWTVVLDEVFGGQATSPLGSFSSDQASLLFQNTLGRDLFVRLRCAQVSGGDTIAYVFAPEAASDVVYQWLGPEGQVLFQITENGIISPLTSTLSGLVTTSGILAARKTVAFADSPYTVLSTDENLDASMAGGAITFTLPATVVNGRRLNFKKITSDANVVTLARNGNKINGTAADLTFSAPGTSLTLLGNSTTADWEIV